MFTYFPPVCPANAANNQADQDQTFLSLPGCVYTGQTACCGHDSAQEKTFVSLPGCVAPTTFVSRPGCVPTFVSLPGCVQTGQAAGGAQAPAQGQAQTYFPSIGHCGAEAQFPTLSIKCVQVTTGLLTQVVGCNSGAQAQTYFPSIGHCAAAQAPAQAQFPTLSMQCVQVTTGLLTQVAGCNGGAQAQTYFPSIGSCAAAQAPAQPQTLPPPPTIPQDCGVSWNCGAQAQFPTLSMQCAQTVTKGLTAALGCNGGAQAQTYFPSIGSCAAAQAPAQAQTEAQAQTIFPTIGITTQLLTHIVGCNGGAQAQTYFPSIGSCAAAQAPAQAQTQAQAQTIFPTIGITTQLLTKIVGCNGGAQAQTYFPSIGSC